MTSLLWLLWCWPVRSQVNWEEKSTLSTSSPSDLGNALPLLWGRQASVAMLCSILRSPKASRHLQIPQLLTLQQQSCQCHPTSPLMQYIIPSQLIQAPADGKRHYRLTNGNCLRQSRLHAGTWLVYPSDLNSGLLGWSCKKPGSSEGLATGSARNLVHVSLFWLISRLWRAPSRQDVTSPEISAVLVGWIADGGRRPFGTRILGGEPILYNIIFLIPHNQSLNSLK